MEFSIAQLLENFSDQKLVAPKAVEKKLGISENDSSIRKLQVALDALEKVGILEKDKGRYRRTGEDELVEGRLRCSSKGFCFAIQDIPGVEDIYIRESRLSNAWNGDRVLVKVTKEGIRRRSPEGEVRLIIERSNPTLLAKVKLTDAGYRAIPLDDRLLLEIELVPDEQVPDLSVAVDKLIHLEMVRYTLGSHLPRGRVAQILGSDAESTADVDLVCCKYNLPRKFTDKAIAEADSLPKTLKKADLKNRLDLRQDLTIAIADGASISIAPAQDSEDGWHLNVHIPDVATYVASDSAMDEVARQRLRSIFLRETILPMLPNLGILQQAEHLAISVIMLLGQDGELKVFEIQPSVVTVDSRLSYEEAQVILNSGRQDDQNGILINQIAAVSALIKQHRANAFSVTLPNAIAQETDEGIQGIVLIPEPLPIYGMVAEIMILVNQAIATHLSSLALPAIFCNQATPELNKVLEWMKLLECMGVDMALENPEMVQPEDYKKLLAQVSEQLPDKNNEKNNQDILKYLLLSLVKHEEYSFTPAGHFGLSLIDQPYIHAIAPQHRYGDLLVQRLLHLVAEEGRDRRSSRIKEGVELHSSSCHGQVNWSVLPPDRERQIKSELEMILPRLNQQENLFYRAKSDLESLRKAEYMQARTGENFFGIITGVQSYGFFVEIESLLVEGLVHVSSLKDDWYEFPQNNLKGRGKIATVLVGRRSGRQYSLGDRVEVQVKSVDYYRQQIDLAAVTGGTGNNNQFDEGNSEFDEDYNREREFDRTYDLNHNLNPEDQPFDEDVDSVM